MVKIITYRRLGLVQRVMVCVSGITALSSGMAVSTVHHLFDWHCPLFAKVNITYNATSRTVEVTSATWGDMNICHFATFEGVAVFIASLICFLFLLQLNEMASSGSYSSRASREAAFMLPILILDISLCVCTVTSSVYISDGLHMLCDSLEQSVNMGSKIGHTCKDLEQNTWFLSITVPKPKYPFKFFSYLTLASILRWVVSAVLMGQMTLTAMQAYLHTATEPIRAAVQRKRGASRRDAIVIPSNVSLTDVDVESLVESESVRASSFSSFGRQRTLLSDHQKQQNVLHSLRQVKDYHYRHSASMNRPSN